MQRFLSAVGSNKPASPRASRLVVLLLLLVLVGSALPAVQAQGISMYIYMASRGGNVVEDAHKHAKFPVVRTSLGAGYGHEAHIRLCFSGSATLGTDYYVRSNAFSRLSPSGNCITDKFLNGYTRLWYYIIPINDSDDESNESVTVTMSQATGNPFPSGYYFPRRNRKATFRIIDND